MTSAFCPFRRGRDASWRDVSDGLAASDGLAEVVVGVLAEVVADVLAEVVVTGGLPLLARLVRLVGLVRLVRCGLPFVLRVRTGT
ncbi:hypothetical protein ACFY0R_00585 [Streptomyces sp. NPDC001633]|uniref:hypothetical protein n=1 Tax=Streptomyces sp. NPDC001633 TaxID=3364595 RepID=UPI0036D04D71